MSKQLIPFISLSIIFGVLLLFTSCQPDESLDLTEEEEEFLPIDQFPGVDAELWSYYSNFEKEAAARGLDIDLFVANITGEISEINEEHVAGRCTFSSASPNAITIDKSFWDRSSPLFREFVVFHELGHCFLGRGHEEGVNANGTCKSIMRSGVEDCRDNYRSTTRAAYLDELFGAIDM